MNDFFKFNDKRIVSILWLIISIVLLSLLIFSIEIIELFIVVLIIFTICIVAMIFTLNEGIHFNYKKGKITIIKGMMIKIIPMKDVKYFNLEEISKVKKVISHKNL